MSLRCCVAGSAALFAMGLLPTIASGQLLGPGGEPAPTTYREVDRLGDSAYRSISAALHQACIDVDVRDGLIALTSKAVSQISNWREAHFDDASTLFSELREARLWVITLNGEINQLKLKQPCPPPVTKTARPPDQPIPPAVPPGSPPIPQPLPPSAENCFTEEAARALEAAEDLVRELQRKDTDLADAIEQLRSEIAQIQRQIDKLDARLYNFGADDDESGDAPKLSRVNLVNLIFDGYRQITSRNDEIKIHERDEKINGRFLENAESEVDRLKALPPCDKNTSRAPEPPSTPGIPPEKTTTLPRTDTSKQEGARIPTETESERGKKHPKKEAHRKRKTNGSRRAAKRPVDDNPSAQSAGSMSRETARTVETLIGIGVGVGLSRTGHRGDGGDDRNGAPGRTSPRAVPRD